MRHTFQLTSILITSMCLPPTAHGADDVRVTLSTHDDTLYSDVITVLDRLVKIGIARVGLFGPQEKGLRVGEIAASVKFDGGVTWFRVATLYAQLRKAGIARIRFEPTTK